MSCSACSKRRQGRIVPVIPPRKQPEKQANPKGAVEQGNLMRGRLRYTGR